MRDIVQNHLLQVHGARARWSRRPRSAPTTSATRRCRCCARCARSPANDVATYVVRASTAAIAKSKGVLADSRTPTYAAMRFLIDNWRWQGVPFYLRAGKKLAQQLTEVSIHFQPVPLVLFQRGGEPGVQPTVLTLRIQPQEGISLRFVAKVPGDNLSVGNVLMNMSYADTFGKSMSEAYERLLLDCMRGDATLFASATRSSKRGAS